MNLKALMSEEEKEKKTEKQFKRLNKKLDFVMSREETAQVLLVRSV